MNQPRPGEADNLVRHTRVFASETASARSARLWAAPLLACWGVDVRSFDAVLIVSELVANAVTHGAGDVALSLARLGDRVRIEVFDSGGGSVVGRPAPPEATSGRGVHIVAQTAESWGVDWSPDGGKTVWAELGI